MADPFLAKGASTVQAISAGHVNHLPIVAHFARGLGLVEIVNGLVPTQMEVEPGLIVLGLMLDTLSGRSPLYHLQTAFEDCDRALLFGRELPAEYFSDDNVGRMLDCLFATGTQRIFSALSVRALERFPVSTHHAHFDTTSVSLYGDYLNAQSEAAPFEIAHGYSKDKRPDLKQFVLSLLCVDGNVPIVGKLEDGNASDKAINHRLLGAVCGHLHKHGVAQNAFIYIADSAMVTEANLAQIGERTRFITRLPATYNAHERVILDAIEADDGEELGRIAHSAPTKNRPGASYRVHEGTVSLYGNDYRVPDQGEGGYSAEQILKTYKEQHGIEKNFGFLKDDQIVNSLFLKRPERIEALGLILLISLLIWRLIELVMRTALQARQATVPGWDNKPTARPTAYMVTWKFKGVVILCVNGQRLLAKPLTDTQQAFLQALQVSESCFTQFPRDG